MKSLTSVELHILRMTAKTELSILGTEKVFEKICGKVETVASEICVKCYGFLWESSRQMLRQGSKSYT